MLIEQAELDDIDALSELASATYRDHFAHIWSAEGLNDYIDQQFGHAALGQSLGAQSMRYFVLREAEDVVGYIKVLFDRDLPIGGGRGMELEKIYIRSGVTGHGYGASLLEFALDLAQCEKQTCVWLDVLKSNHGGQAFYKRHGFEIVGETPFATDLSDFGFWVMRRETR